MRGILLIATLLLTQLFATELTWEKNLSIAFEKSTTQKRPLMVVVEKDNCQWCEKIKDKTLKDQTIAIRLKKFIIVKVDREDLKSEYIPYPEYVPTIYFLSPQKKILERAVGYFGVLDFNSWIDDVEAKLKNSLSVP